MLVFSYHHGICGILLCREFRFVFLKTFVLGNRELFRLLRVQSELPLTSSLQIVPENVRHCKNGHIGRWPNAACLEFLAAACVPRSFYERALALFLVFPYLAKKTPLG